MGGGEADRGWSDCLCCQFKKRATVICQVQLCGVRGKREREKEVICARVILIETYKRLKILSKYILNNSYLFIYFNNSSLKII